MHSMFPKVSQKGKNGMFTGPQIQELLQSIELKNKTSSTERDAWQAFMLAAHGFLGEKGDIYKESGENLIDQYHFFVEYLWNLRFALILGIFWLHWGDVSKEHGELSPQDTEVKKKR